MNKRLENMIANIIVGIILIALTIAIAVIGYLILNAAGYFFTYFMQNIIYPMFARNMVLGFIVMTIPMIFIVHKIFKEA